MKLVTLALAGLVGIGATAASAGDLLAQAIPRPVGPVADPVGSMPAHMVTRIVRRMGLDPVGMPVRHGRVFMQQALDYYGRPFRVTVDAHMGEVISVRYAAAAQMPPYEAYDRPYREGRYRDGPYREGPYREGPYRPYASVPPMDDDDIEPQQRPQRLPPQVIPAQPPGVAPARPASAPPKAAPKAAAVTPAKPPAPRKRPAAAPQEVTAGSVDPLPATPEKTGPQNAPPPAAPDGKPATPAITPVAPLE